LDASPVPPLEEALSRAKRVVGWDTGIVRRVVVDQAPVDGPRTYIARSEPADARFSLGVSALNAGSAASSQRDRAVMKAVGESIERYSGAYPGDLVLSAANDLEGAIAPEQFELFAPEQFTDKGFGLQQFSQTSVVRWVEGTSLSTGKRAYLPACMVYVPYDVAEDEDRICDRISTGLACAHSRSAALAKGILEVVERDALMLVWHNRLGVPKVALDSTDDPFVQAGLDAFTGMALNVEAYCVTMDVPVAVILAVARSTVDAVPHTVLGLGTACHPTRALGLALEELALGVWGMRLSAAYSGDDRHDEFESLDARGIAYASRRDFAANLDFLDRGPAAKLSELPQIEAANPLEEMKALTDCLVEQGLEPFGCDVTTDDIDDVGFKVCRVVVPGMRPLDIKHSRRHLGGRRLYDAPVKVGRLPRPYRLEELNQDPHPFP
jgi:ribosomal protein S12 methylthiotransferase accessory factor